MQCVLAKRSAESVKNCARALWTLADHSATRARVQQAGGVRSQQAQTCGSSAADVRSRSRCGRLPVQVCTHCMLSACLMGLWLWQVDAINELCGRWPSLREVRVASFVLRAACYAR